MISALWQDGSCLEAETTLPGLHPVLPSLHPINSIEKGKKTQTSWTAAGVCRRAEHKPGVLELSWMLDCELEHTYFGMQNQKLISSRALGQYLGPVIFSSSCSKICLSSFVEL